MVLVRGMAGDVSVRMGLRVGEGEDAGEGLETDYAVVVVGSAVVSQLYMFM